jgi:hypothetical protein
MLDLTGLSSYDFVVVWAWLTFKFSDTASVYIVFFAMLFLGWAGFRGLKTTALTLLEARDVQIINGTITVSHMHLSERQYRLIPNHIKKTKVKLRRFQNVPIYTEPMWLLRFNGWHFAVVPIDWQNPLETQPANLG